MCRLQEGRYTEMLLAVLAPLSYSKHGLVLAHEPRVGPNIKKTTPSHNTGQGIGTHWH